MTTALGILVWFWLNVELLGHLTNRPDRDEVENDRHTGFLDDTWAP